MFVWLCVPVPVCVCECCFLLACASSFVAYFLAFAVEQQKEKKQQRNGSARTGKKQRRHSTAG